MKIKVYSNHDWIEDSFPFFIEHISKTKGVTVESIDRAPAPKNVPAFRPDPRPERRDNGFIYPHWPWFYRAMTEPVEDEYGIVIWHDDRETGRKLQKGAKRRYNGVYDSLTPDRAFNAVVFASEHDLDKRTRAHHDRYPTMTLFERIFLHEVSHGLARFEGNTDRTHFFDYTLHNIPSAFNMYDLSDFKLQRRILRKADRALAYALQLAGRERWHPPLDEMDTVSQPFGVRNEIYLQTGHHVGVDFAVPTGTRVYAPKDCTVSKVGAHYILGNWLEIETTWRGEKVWTRYLHLQHRPEKGEYKRGEVMALTGNTGMGTGPHLHVDARRGPIHKAKPDNFRSIFINPNNLWK